MQDQNKRNDRLAEAERLLDERTKERDEAFAKEDEWMRQRDHFESLYLQEQEIRLFKERLLDEARGTLEAVAEILNHHVDVTEPLSLVAEACVVIADTLARLGAAAPQQEPATSSDDGQDAVVSEETRPL